MTTDHEANTPFQEMDGQPVLLVGRIREGQGVWPVLENVKHANVVRLGVLIVFSQGAKGRLGIVCNRYITSAVLDGDDGITGLEAARALLSTKRGMFGFRGVISNENTELEQSLSIDIDLLLDLRGGAVSPADLLDQLFDSGPHLSDADTDHLYEDTLIDMPAVRLSDITDTPHVVESYFNFFMPEDSEAEHSDVQEISIVATDSTAAGGTGAVDSEAHTYEDFLDRERQKVVADLERSLQRAVEDIPRLSNEAVEEMQLFSEMLKSEQNRAKKWEGLDDIPTPIAAKPAAADSPLQRRLSGKFNAYDETQQSGRFNSFEGKPPGARTPSFDGNPSGGRTSSFEGSGLSGAYATFDTEIDSALTPTEPVESVKGLPAHTRRKLVVVAMTVATVGAAVWGLNYLQVRSYVDSCFKDSRDMIMRGKYQEAAFLMEQAAKKEPGNPRVRMQEAVAHLKAADHAEALAAFDKALALGAPKLPAFLGRATALFEAKSYDKAIAECKVILSINPQCVEAYGLKAGAHAHLNQSAQSEQDWSAALDLEKNPDARAKLLLERGYARARMGRLDDAKKDFSEAIAFDSSPAALLQRANLLKRLKKFDKAVQDFSVVIQSRPDDYEALVGRANCYQSLGRNQDAIKDLTQAIAASPVAVEALIQRGSMYLSRGDYRLAADDLETAAVLNPTIAETHEKLKSVYTHIRRTTPKLVMVLPTETVESVKIELPADVNKIVEIGYQSLNRGELAKAAYCFTEAIKRDNNNISARRYFAHTLFQMARYREALSQFSAIYKANAMRPNDSVVMGKALARSGKRDQGIEVLEMALHGRPSDLACRVELCNLLFSAGKKDLAKQTAKDGLNNADAAGRDKLEKLVVSFEKNKVLEDDEDDGSQKTGPSE